MIAMIRNGIQRWFRRLASRLIVSSDSFLRIYCTLLPSCSETDVL